MWVGMNQFLNRKKKVREKYIFSLCFRWYIHLLVFTDIRHQTLEVLVLGPTDSDQDLLKSLLALVLKTLGWNKNYSTTCLGLCLEVKSHETFSYHKHMSQSLIIYLFVSIYHLSILLIMLKRKL